MHARTEAVAGPGRVWNFCAGPCTLPVEVLEAARDEIVDHHGAGMSLLEMSHRSAEYDAVHESARTLALEVAEAPPDFDVLFVQGGASLQFAMLPMNLLGAGAKAGYVNTGSWAAAAIDDARPYGEIYVAWDGAEGGYTRTPAPDEIRVEPDTRYVHITSNETIGGIRYAEWPDPGVPLVADVSSELLARPLPWDRLDVAYGGVQKNLGPAGMAVVYVRTSILESTTRDAARYLRYDVHQGKGSLFNTPPTFTVAMVEKMLAWMKRKGGLAAIEREAARKSAVIYDTIDASDGWYRCPVDVASRSHMNVVFRLPDEALEKRFVAEAEAAGYVNLKGHRSVGGCRASLYAAMPLEGAQALAAFMERFRRANS